MTSRFRNVMLLLNESDVRKCLSMKDCIDVNRRALYSLRNKGGAVVPSRLALPYPTVAGSRSQTVPITSKNAALDWSLFKPAAYYGQDATATSNSTQIGMKIVGVRADNPSKGLPLVPATVLLLNAATGIVEAVINGTYLTGARTAAGSAVATELVSRTRNSAAAPMKHLVVFGAGLQCECHMEALLCVQPSIDKVTIINRSMERAERALAALPASIEGSIVLLDDRASIRQVLSIADVVVTCTNTTTPLFDGSWLKKDCHVNGIGSYTSEMQECDITTVDRSRVLIDTQEARNVGDLKHLSDVEINQHPVALLADALENPTWLTQPTESTKVDCTFYKAVGTAIQDVMTATLVVERARELGLGTEVDMSL